MYRVSAPDMSLEASDDGQNFHAVAELPGGRSPEYTISFPAVTAKYFRVTFKQTPPPAIPAANAAPIPRNYGPPSPTTRSPSWSFIPERA